MYGGIIQMVDSAFKPVMPFDSVSFATMHGSTVLPVLGYHAAETLEGYISIFKNKKRGIISPGGEIVLNPEFDEIRNASGSFIVKKQKKYGMYDNVSGEPMIPVKYESIERIKYGESVVREKGKYKLITDAGTISKQSYDTLYPALDISYDATHYVGKRNKLLKLLDGTGTEVCDSVQKISRVQLGGYYEVAVFITQQNGLTGVWDTELNNWKIKPFFSTLGEKITNSLYVINRIVGSDTLKGLFHKKVQVLVPPVYKSLELLREFSLFKVKDASNTHIYLNEDGTVAKDVDKLFAKSLIPDIKKAAAKKEFAATWKPLNGPVGADVTAFYVDKKGGYWLGTGSSGGVFYSSDKGKTWSPRINGTGPVHVLNFLTERDTLYMYASVPDEELYLFDGKEFEKYGHGFYREAYYWHGATQSWKTISAEKAALLNARTYEESEELAEVKIKPFEILHNGKTYYNAYYDGDIQADVTCIVVKKKTDWYTDSISIRSRVPSDLSIYNSEWYAKINKTNYVLFSMHGAYV
ncbi:MAG: WD40/YVTN/BNR-like repeat-containing protein, partial [Flavobacteriales bacterium]